MGVKANYGITFPGYAYVTPDAGDTTVEVDTATPEPGGEVVVTVTALDGVDPAPFRGATVSVAPSTGLTLGSVARTDKDGVTTCTIAIAADAPETERTVTVSCGGVAITAAPTFTITAP